MSNHTLIIPEKKDDLMDIADDIQQIEKQVGRLSAVQKLLLSTDGSVTRLLETVTGNEVTVETRTQEIVGADAETAERLNICEGDQVNHRIVDLKDVVTGRVLVHAISETPVHRISSEFRDDLMKAEIPIGKIMNIHEIEARREILHARVEPAGMEECRIFALHGTEPLLCRQYRIIHNREPLIFIEEQFPYNSFQDERRVIVDCPSRIHVTLIDMHGGSGRVDGGVGMALDNPGIQLEVCYSPDLEVKGTSVAMTRIVRDIASSVLQGINVTSKVAITIKQSYPPHIGLGSGTQLAIATAKAISELFGKTRTTRELALLTGRGGTSGIGTAAFEYGGFIVDGGHQFGPGYEKSDFRPSSSSRGVRAPPVVVRYDFPEDWGIVLATPNLPPGVSGMKEFEIFQNHCPVPLEEVHAVSYEILLKMLPGLIEHDIDLFGSAINTIQGLGFKKVELGLQPPEIPGLLDVMCTAGAAGAGLSSFGPTCYAVCDTGLKDIEKAAQSFMDSYSGGITGISSVRNKGAAVSEFSR